MKNVIFIRLIILSGAFLLSSLQSCVKDRDFLSEPILPPGKTIGPGSLLINEFCASGSTISNPDFPVANGCDWVELYNPSTDTFLLEKDNWLFADSIQPGQADETILKANLQIPPKGFLLLYCDSYDTVSTVIHCPFNLSKSGEAIGVFYKDSTGIFTAIDTHTFGAQTSGVTEGRLPDGGSNWNNSLTPTPGAPNN